MLINMLILLLYLFILYYDNAFIYYCIYFYYDYNVYNYYFN